MDIKKDKKVFSVYHEFEITLEQIQEAVSNMNEEEIEYILEDSNYPCYVGTYSISLSQSSKDTLRKIIGDLNE